MVGSASRKNLEAVKEVWHNAKRTDQQPNDNNNAETASRRRFSSRIQQKRAHSLVEGSLHSHPSNGRGETNQDALQDAVNSETNTAKHVKCNSKGKGDETEALIYSEVERNCEAKDAKLSNDIKFPLAEILKGNEKSAGSIESENGNIRNDGCDILSKNINGQDCGAVSNKCLLEVVNSHGNPEKGGGGGQALGQSKETCSGSATNKGYGGKELILSRSFVYNRDAGAATQSSDKKCVGSWPVTFSLATYNILADCHAQRDYNVPGSWITAEDLNIESRHERLFEELRWLDADIICLQEVGSDYFKDVLEPSFKDVGYLGLYVARLTYPEGEATFYKASKFRLMCSKSLLLKDVIRAEIENLKNVNCENLKMSMFESVDSFAVSLLTRLESVETGCAVCVANVHIAYDSFKRQDKQCLQIAATIRELQQMSEDGDGQIICGDFNSWPSSPPQQLIRNGYLNSENIKRLQDIPSVDMGNEGELSPLFNHVPELFHFNPAPDYRSAYGTVMSAEPHTSRFNCDGVDRQVDFIYFSSSLQVTKVLSVPDLTFVQDGVPNSTFPSDHLSLMAEFSVVSPM